ncbi:MAG: GntP family permease, partial [Bacteroidetes bacterium]
MDPFVLLLISLLVVVGSIIWLRLPAFISLIAAALIVGLLTPDSALEAVAQARGMQAGELVKQGIGGRLTTAFGNTCGK